MHDELATELDEINVLLMTDVGGSPKSVKTVFVDVTRRTILGPDQDGAVLLLLEPNVPVVLRGFASSKGKRQ